MEAIVWHSRMMSDGRIGDKPGVAVKWFGQEWNPPTHFPPPWPMGRADELFLYARGEPLPRETLPEALYVFDRKRFDRMGDLFAAEGVYVVQGKLAQVLSRFDLGRGGLIPITIFHDDKATPVAGQFFFWTFGQKNAFLPQESPKISPAGFGMMVEKDRWRVGSEVEDDDVVLSAEKSCGPPDVWCDPRLMWSLFLSDAFVAALRAAQVKTNFHLHRCRLV